jgi:hypothetical protein
MGPGAERSTLARHAGRLEGFSSEIPSFPLLLKQTVIRVFEEMNRALKKNEVTPLCFQSQNSQLFKISRRLGIWVGVFKKIHARQRGPECKAY